MDTYQLTKNRIISLCYEKRLTIHKLALNSGIAPSTIKNILYGKSKNPGIVTIKMLCDGMNISIFDFFDTDEFRQAEQEKID